MVVKEHRWRQVGWCKAYTTANTESPSVTVAVDRLHDINRTGQQSNDSALGLLASVRKLFSSVIVGCGIPEILGDRYPSD